MWVLRIAIHFIPLYKEAYKENLLKNYGRTGNCGMQGTLTLMSYHVFRNLMFKYNY